jgi:thiol:disulfide interchange protein DsbD
MIPAWHTLAAGLLLVGAGLATAAEAYLEDEQAFKLTPRAVDAQHIALHFDVAPGYHLYRQRISATAEPDSAALGELQSPPGQREHDANFDQDVEVYRQAVTLVLPLRSPPPAPLKLLVNHQGCADQGLCYPPTVQVLKVSGGPDGTLAIERLSEAQAAAWVPEARTTPAATVGGDDGGRFTRVLASRNLLAVAAAFLVAGLLLSLTPCVLPMIPILSSIIVGQGGAASRGQGFALALAYSLGMALVYTAMGMAAGLAGEGLAAALQNAWCWAAWAPFWGRCWGPLRSCWWRCRCRCSACTNCRCRLRCKAA